MQASKMNWNSLYNNFLKKSFILTKAAFIVFKKRKRVQILILWNIIAMICKAYFNLIDFSDGNAEFSAAVTPVFISIHF